MIPFNPEYILIVIPQLMVFLPLTVFVTFCSVLFGLILGFILATAKIKRNPIGYILASSYIMMLRCTPPIVLLFLVYYGLPALLLAVFELDINDYHKGFFVIVTFGLLFAANIAEVMRSAYLSIDKGQREAAISSGLSEFQAFYRIVLPQATVVAIPNFCNALISLMKDGSLAYIIGLMDLLGAGNNIIARNYGTYGLETYLALAIIYWILVIIIEKTLNYLEEYFSRGKSSIARV